MPGRSRVSPSNCRRASESDEGHRGRGVHRCSATDDRKGHGHRGKSRKTAEPRPSEPLSSPPLPNQTRQRITALTSHQSTADFFNGIRKERPSADGLANGGGRTRSTRSRSAFWAGDKGGKAVVGATGRKRRERPFLIEMGSTSALLTREGGLAPIRIRRGPFPLQASRIASARNASPPRRAQCH
jgi:hypothetical protein